MMKIFVHKILKYIIKKYKQNEIRQLTANIHMGHSSTIDYPVIISHGENIYMGYSTTICSGARLQTFPDLLDTCGSIIIGNNSYFCYRLTILAGGDICIGDNVVIGSDVSILSYNHGTDAHLSIPYMHQPLVPGPISIGNNCWIGNNVVILPNVSIGNNCIIGAGSIVTKSFNDNSIIVGNPAKVIKEYNFNDNTWL